MHKLLQGLKGTTGQDTDGSGSYAVKFFEDGAMAQKSFEDLPGAVSFYKKQPEAALWQTEPIPELLAHC